MGITLDSIKEKMLNKKFGKLTILRYLGKSERGDNLWQCKCDCGEIVVGRTANVDKPNSGCRKCKIASGDRSQKMRTYLLGKKFGRLTVTDYAGKNRFLQVMWKCKCDCGNETIVRSSSLISGDSQSCGCYSRDRFVSANTTHGLHKHPLYAVWAAMRDRCYNENSDAYKYYGERGISVYPEWKEDFLPFYLWAIKNGYEYGLTIERINNNGNYEPGNCIWATQQEQVQNTRRTKLTKALVDRIRADSRTNVVLAKEYGVDESTISRVRSRRTWSNYA